MKNKMNVLYKIAFILLLICVLLFVAAIAVAYAFDRPHLSAVFSGGGAVLAFAGIILAVKSNPKKRKETKSEENIDNNTQI